MSIWHPRPDASGARVRINAPTTPTEISAWSGSTALACVVPEGRMPDALNGVPFDAWRPDGPNAWPTVILDEPVFQCPRGLRPAAGAVVLEADGRCWLAMPTNAFGGLPYVFPKGRVDPGGSLTATAMREVWEELGLRVRLTAHLIDVPRSTTYTRLYLAERVGGHPGDMSWESQGAVLCPLERLHELLPSPYDTPVLEALWRLRRNPREVESCKERVGDGGGGEAPGLLVEGGAGSPLFIINAAASSRAPIREDQAQHLARLIRDLEAAVQRAGLGRDDCDRLFEMPEYDRLISGACATGWVCRDLSSDGVEFMTIACRPEMLADADLRQLRRYIHALMRGERWTHPDGSHVLDAILGGALGLVARRLEGDPRLREAGMVDEVGAVIKELGHRGGARRAG